MIVIGLTGGIGAGKSTVSEYLASKGYEVIDADKIAREIVSPGSRVLEQIVDTFGPEILLNDGALDRKKLAGVIFSDIEQKRKLDNIMHKSINEIITKRIDMLNKVQTAAGTGADPQGIQKGVVFLDAPLLYETGLDACTAAVWFVDADEEKRIDRIMTRDHLTKEEAKKILMSQMPRDEKLARADRVLMNTGSRENLFEQVDKLLNAL